MNDRTPSLKYAWYVVAVLTLANVSGFVDRQILSLLVVPIRRDLGISDTQMSLLMGLSFALFYTVLGLPIARWADRGSRRGLLVVGVAMWSVMTGLSGLAATFPLLLLARVGVGVGEATLAPTSTSLLADYFPREMLGRALSVYGLGVFLGSGLAYVIGGQIVGLVSDRGLWTLPLVGAVHPWQTVFFFIGAPGLLIALLMFTVKEPRRAEGTGAAVPIGEVFGYLRANSRTFTLQSLGFALSATVNYGIAAWLATFLIRTYGWTATRAGTVQGALTMTIGVVGTLAGGWMSDRWVRAGRVDGPLLVGITGAAGMLVSATAYPLMASAWAAVAWLAVVNFFAALPWGAASAAAAEIVPARIRAQGIALYFLVLSLVSGVLGPFAVAFLTDHVFGRDSALGWSLAIVNVVGMSLAIALLWAARGSYRETVSRLQQQQH